MRERHNIVGSEVGHARPPIYLRAAVRRRPRRPRGRLLLAMTILALITAGGALAYFDLRDGEDSYRLDAVWPVGA
jgi:hypothetical protein